MSNVTRLPPHAKTIHIEADIPISQRDEFDQAVIEIIAGERPRMDTLDRDVAAITRRALEALKIIETAINSHPTTGGARRLVKFLAGVYNGQEYPFDLTELRGLDTDLANACLDYLNYDRLGIKEVHSHLANGDRDLHRWLEEYRIGASSSRSCGKEIVGGQISPDGEKSDESGNTRRLGGLVQTRSRHKDDKLSIETEAAPNSD